MEEEEPPKTDPPVTDTDTEAPETDPPATDTDTEAPETDPDEFKKWSPGVVMRLAKKQEPFATVGNFYAKEINWRLYVPEDYDSAKKYPVFLFLHGSGECGTDNTNQLNRMIFHLYNQPNSSIRDAICIYPQTPGGWDSATLYALMEHVASLYSTDTDRYYVMGLSMGGYGTWDIIAEYPDYFAAAVPICGGCDMGTAEALADMPIYIVHGAKDGVVPVYYSREMYKALKAAGSTSVIYEELPDYDHNAWDYVTEHEEILVWMFEQTREGRK